MKASDKCGRGAGKKVGRVTFREVLRDDEERLRLAIAATNDKIWDLDVATGCVRWNENFADAFQRPLETSNSLQWWIDRIHPEDRERTTSSLRAAIQGSASNWKCEYRFQRPDGSWADLYDRAFIARDSSGKARRVIGAMQDLTERNRTERELREREDLLQHIFQALAAEVAVVDNAGRIIAVNREWLRFAAENGAADSPAVDKGANYLDVCRRSALRGDREAGEALAGIESVLDGRSPRFCGDYLCRTPSGERWFAMVVVAMKDGDITGAVISHRNITEQKQIERALRESEERLRLAQEAGHVGVFDWDIVRNKAVVTPELEEIFGLRQPGGASESCYRAWSERVHPEDLPRLERLCAEWMQSGREIERWEYRFLRQGETRWLSGSGRLCRDPSGKPLRMVGTILDVTERKLAEEALSASEERFRIVAENARAVFGIVQGKRFVYANPFLAELSGYSVEEILSMDFVEMVHPDYREQVADYARRRQLGEPVPAHYEFAMVTKAGETRWMDFAPGLSEYRGRPAIVGTAFDITARKRAEDSLRASLLEKEVLLKEIHHRVKNNMQVLSSLANLQAQSFARGEQARSGQRSPAHEQVLQAAFADLHDRIRSMALVHEKLYQSENLAAIDFAEYAESLLHRLWSAHAAGAVIQLRLALEPVVLTVDRAVPCGLILNELASNALKHAFRGRSGGAVLVSSCCSPDGSAVIRVSDNGVGLPPGWDWRREPSLGLQLVQMLSRQLQGVVEARQTAGGGTEFELKFAAGPYSRGKDQARGPCSR